MKFFRLMAVLGVLSVILFSSSGCVELMEEFAAYSYTQDYQEEITATEVSDTDNDPVEEKPLYALGDRGPSGGHVFYDKGFYEDGWRYLEAAPSYWSGSGIEPKAQWGAQQFEVDPPVTGAEIGQGKMNTERIVSYHNRLAELYPDKGDYYENPKQYYSSNDGTLAAGLCDAAIIAGFDDWFLPSTDELAAMHEVLYKNGKGNINADMYWSSTEKDMYSGMKMNFWMGVASGTYKSTSYYVRPIRAF
jgi:hypothetical protein